MSREHRRFAVDASNLCIGYNTGRVARQCLALAIPLDAVNGELLHLSEHILDVDVELAVRIVVADVVGEVSGKLDDVTILYLPLDTRELVVALLREAELATDHRLERWVEVGWGQQLLDDRTREATEIAPRLVSR